MKNEIYYFGCWKDAGHYLHLPDGNFATRNLPSDFPCEWRQLDTLFLPHGIQHQGWAQLVKIDRSNTFWTILSFHDGRGGSHSTFVARGDHSREDMLTLCKKYFPHVFARMKFEVTFDWA
jgi:hypothetical protein